MTGLIAISPEGMLEISGKAIIMACGGFEGSPEMRRRYLGEGWDLVKLRGTRYNTGDGLRMALDIGAQSAGHWGGCHASVVSEDSPQIEAEAVGAIRYSYLFGVMVNTEAKRFVDEGENFIVYTYAKMGRQIAKQPHGVAYQIFDGKGLPLLRPEYLNAQRAESNTLEGLAEEIGLDPKSFVETIKEYNNAITKEVRFDPAKRDGLRTNGLTPDKTNWARPIDAAPLCGLCSGVRYHVQLRRPQGGRENAHSRYQGHGHRGTLRHRRDVGRRLLPQLPEWHGSCKRRGRRADRGGGGGEKGGREDRIPLLNCIMDSDKPDSDKMSFAPLNRTRLSEEIYLQLKEAILSSGYEPGQRLPSEKEFCQQFQVGRAVVREALRKLENSGLIHVRPGSMGGVFAKRPEADTLASTFEGIVRLNNVSMEELTAARAVVETGTFRVLLERIQEADFEPLQRRIDEAREALESGDEERKNVGFHIAIAELAGNGLLTGIIRGMFELEKKLFFPRKYSYQRKTGLPCRAPAGAGSAKRGEAHGGRACLRAPYTHLDLLVSLEKQ